MGQYFKAVSLDAKEVVRPFGAKIVEHSWARNKDLIKIERLLSPGNKWHKTRIVWAGDYMKPGIFMDKSPKYPDESLYAVAHDWKDSSEPADGPEAKYLINHTKNVYINLKYLPSIINERGWKVHPLPILTTTSNGEGGGDYGDDEDTNVGSWAGDVISTDFNRPKGMKKFKGVFIYPYGRPQIEETKS